MKLIPKSALRVGQALTPKEEVVIAAARSTSPAPTTASALRLP